MTDDIVKTYYSFFKIFNPSTNQWETVMNTKNEVTEQEIDITQIPVEKLQLRNGWKVEVVLNESAICYVVARDTTGHIQAGHRKKNGRMFNYQESEFDVILKAKQKVKMAPFYYQPKKENTIRTSQFIDTEEGAQKWCSEMHYELIKWLGDTPMAVEIDQD